MRSIFALGVFTLAGLTAAQDEIQNNYPYQIDPESVSPSDRQTWCDNQKSQCPLICLQQDDVTTMDTEANDCDPDTLLYKCVCDNGVSPNITQFSQTLPYYICTEWGNQCVDDCEGDNACADSCRADHPCGAQDPQRPNTTASSTSVSPTSSETNAAESSDVDTSTFADDEGAASSLQIGVTVLGSAVLVGFGFLL